MEIIKGVYQLNIPIPHNPLEYVKCYLVEGTNGYLMVDTGWYSPESFNALEDQLKALGLTLKDITRVVVTHVHPDHIGLAGKIKQASPKSQLIMHRWESDLIESRYIKFAVLLDKMSHLLQYHGVPLADLASVGGASMPMLQHVAVTLTDEVFYGGETLDTGIFNLEAIWTPGHSPGHICLYEPVHQLLFSGDHVLGKITPNISYHVQSGGNPLGNYLHALDKLRSLPVKQVLPAHGDIFTDLPGRIDEIVHHHEKRQSEILQIIAKESHTAYEVFLHMTWNIPGNDFNRLPPLHKRIAITETIAHLECMRWQGTVVKIAKDNMVSYVSK